MRFISTAVSPDAPWTLPCGPAAELDYLQRGRAVNISLLTVKCLCEWPGVWDCAFCSIWGLQWAGFSHQHSSHSTTVCTSYIKTKLNFLLNFLWVLHLSIIYHPISWSVCSFSFVIMSNISRIKGAKKKLLTYYMKPYGEMNLLTI